MEISMENVLFDIMFLRVDNQRDAKMKVGSDSEMWNTPGFLSKYKAVWKENLVIYHKLLGAFLLCILSSLLIFHLLIKQGGLKSFFNSLSPNSDQHQFSPNDIQQLTIEIRLWEFIKWSPKRKCFDLFSNSLNVFFKEMYRDQFGEFACGYWDLKG